MAKAKIEILIHDEYQDQVVGAIVSAARTGQVGDGKIWVTSVDEVIRVRTGERGEVAL